MNAEQNDAPEGGGRRAAEWKYPCPRPGDRNRQCDHPIGVDRNRYRETSMATNGKKDRYYGRRQSAAAGMYHYTRIEVFRSILDSRKIGATRYDQMNDESELRSAWKG